MKVGIQNSPKAEQQRLQAQKTNQQKAIENIAGGMETQFAQMMIREMRKTIPNENEKSSAEKIYQDYLNEEQAKIMSDNNSLGIKKAIIKQLSPYQRYNNVSINSRKELP